MTNWHLFAQAINAPRKPKQDIIVSAQGGDWITADGGQGSQDGFKGGWMKRKFQESGEITGEFGKKARLLGWVDLDYLYAVAQAAFPRL